MAIFTNYSNPSERLPSAKSDMQAVALGKWMQQEESSLPQRRLAIAKKYWETYVVETHRDPSKNSKLQTLKHFFCIFSNDPKASQKFDEAIETKNFSNFLSLFNAFTRDKLNLVENLYSTTKRNLTSLRRPLTEEDQKDLKRYMKDMNFSGVVCLSDGTTTYRFASEKFESLDENHTCFAIHSVGKVYTGMLVLSMMEQGIITESLLNSSLQLDEKTILPAAVQKRLSEVTMRDLMLHEGGLGDYLEKYDKAIKNALATQTAQNSPPLTIGRLEELLQYVDESLYPPGQEHYSNLGLLLVGLSIQYCYNQKLKSLSKPALSYGEILRQHILIPAKITHFSEQKPLYACFNPSDETSHYYYGTPAGGYWTSAEDLLKFGIWINQKCQDPTFRYLMDKHGKEFCCDGIVWHNGGTPSASACLQTSLINGFSVAIVSDQEGSATRLQLAIEEYLLSK